jgi:hypothetical protein
MGTLLDIAMNTILNDAYYGTIKIKKNNIINKIQKECPPSVQEEADPQRCAVSVKSALSYPSEHPSLIWRNPYPQGTPEARAESLRVIEAARRGEAI